MSDLILIPYQINPKRRPPKGTPPESLIKAPGQILRLDKGNPPFYKCFQTLYDEFEKKMIQGNHTLTQSFDDEAEELLKIIEKLFLFYGLKMYIIDYRESPHRTLCCLKNLLEIIHSFSRDLLMKLNLNPIYIYADNMQIPPSKSPLHPEDHTFIISSFKNEEEISQKFYALLLKYISKLTYKLNLSNLANSKETEQKPKSPLRSILKEQTSLFSSSANISLLVQSKETPSKSQCFSYRKELGEQIGPKKYASRVSFKSM